MNQDDNPSWDYKPDDSAAEPAAGHGGDRHTKHPSSVSHEISWEAPEFIYEHHGTGWYLVLAMATAAAAVLTYFVTSEIFATAVMVVLGVIVAVFASQKPGQAKYEIARGKLTINGKNYNLGSYKSFTVAKEGSLYSLNLFPLKKFLPPLSAYFEPQNEQKIIESLGNYLPYDPRKLDSIDRIARRLRL